jgi:predicted DNA-binding transcriptional regulator AlpA
LSRAEAAEYVGVSTSLFEEMVADGRMPPPKQINSRKVWMRTKIEKAFAELPEEGQDKESSSPWRDCA